MLGSEKQSCQGLHGPAVQRLCPDLHKHCTGTDRELFQERPTETKRPVSLSNRSLSSEKTDTLWLMCLKEMGSSRSSAGSSKSLPCLAWTGFPSLARVSVYFYSSEKVQLPRVRNGRWSCFAEECFPCLRPVTQGCLGRGRHWVAGCLPSRWVCCRMSSGRGLIDRVACSRRGCKTIPWQRHLRTSSAGSWERTQEDWIASLSEG